MNADKISNLAHQWAIQTYMKGLGRRCDIDTAREAFERELESLTASHQRLKEALEQIAAIEDKLHGPDWEEIEEARKIAELALKDAP